MILRSPLLLLALGALVTANESSCGPKAPSPVANCDHVDHGSCGNACCILEVDVAGSSTDQVYAAIKEFLAGGSPDSSYNYSTGPNKAGINPGDDLRQYNATADYIFQGTHATTGGFVDSLDFNIKKNAAIGGATIRGGSVSNIHGAYGDNGQNYKNLRYLLSNVDDPTIEPKIIHGCGAK